jgi:FHS family L-fucose permease-like MFS transporter
MFVWGGMMVGRFLGAFVMRAIPPEKVLAAFSIGAFVVMMIASLAHGPTAMYGLMAVGFFHSIMFPTIFALAIRGLGPLTEEGSGWLIWAIAGGALVIVQGKLADQFGIQHSFLLTAACELFVLYYALWGSRSTAAMAPEQLRPDAA